MDTGPSASSLLQVVLLFTLGEWAEDLRNGQGKYTYVNSDAYEGEWSNNLRHGKGSYTFSATGAKYVGNWVNGRKEGPGEFLYANYRYNGLFTGDQVTAIEALCSVA